MKPLATKLQKKDQDVYQAFCMIDGATLRLEQIRQSLDTEFHDWLREAKDLALSVDSEIEVPRITGRQTHRANAASSGVEEHYIEEDRAGSSRFSLLTRNIIKMKYEPEDIARKLKF